jgi:hypothetical protein
VSAQSYVHLLSYFEIVFCGVALAAIVRSESVRKFSTLAVLLGVRLLSGIACLAFIAVSGHGIEKHLGYHLYFYTYWFGYAVEAVLQLVVIYGIFKLAMAPLKGLASLGVLVFRWAAAISVVLSFGVAFGPHLSSSRLLMAAVTQLQQTSSILTLCLLLFVCFAIRPMGLSYKSRIFGVSLGLGIVSTINLVNSAWLSHSSGLYDKINLTSGVAACIAFFLWSVYFSLPEPQRRIIAIPTTSPFLRWNQISIALGDDPGFVAIGGIPPEIFASAEIEIMRRASVKMTALATPGTTSKQYSLSA